MVFRAACFIAVYNAQEIIFRSSFLANNRKGKTNFTSQKRGFKPAAASSSTLNTSIDFVKALTQNVAETSQAAEN